jgi:hypothetical protein
MFEFPGDHSYDVGTYGVTIVNGYQNRIFAESYGFIGGGLQNWIGHSGSLYAYQESVGTGASEQEYSFIGNGYQNKVYHGGHNTIVNGYINFIKVNTASDFNFIGNGSGNYITASSAGTAPNGYNSILNGQNNRIYATNENHNTIIGGYDNEITHDAGDYNFIAGGTANEIGTNVDKAFIVGSGITADEDNTTYVNNLKTVGNLETGGGTGTSNHIRYYNYGNDSTSHMLAQFAREGDGANQARGRLLLYHDDVAKVNIGTISNTYFNGGNVGIGTTGPVTYLHIVGTTDSSLSAHGLAVFGATNTTNITIDQNEIIARNNGATSTLHLQAVGGGVKLGGALGVGVTPNATVGRIDASNDIVAYSSSDIRFKKNTTPISDALFKVQQIQGIEFDWIPSEEHHGYEGHDVGVVAQEVIKVLPEVVQIRESGYMAVKYEKMIPLLIEAIKEQQEQIVELKQQIEEIKDAVSK